MLLGRLVFPVIMLGFVVFFFGFVLTTPVDEAVEGSFVRAQDGDAVLIEFTAFYGSPGSGSMFFTTQEERVQTLPTGKIPTSVQSDPISIQLSPNQPAAGLREFLLGKRSGASFSTGAVAAEDAFGDWQDERELPRVLAELPYVVRFDPSVPVGSGQTFNTAQYLEFWRGRNVNLQVGTEWACEGTQLWKCRADQISTTDNVFVYSRLVQAGQSYPVEPIWRGLQTGGDFAWTFSVAPGTTSDVFGLRLDPPVGARFQFLEDAGGAFLAGTYEVVSVGAQGIQVKYTMDTPAEPGLIGESIYYDIQVVRVNRPTP
jgi:hypothetical protein